MVEPWTRRSLLLGWVLVFMAPALSSCTHYGVARRQPRVGYLAGAGNPDFVDAFHGELSRLGYVPGGNLHLVQRLARPNTDDFCRFAAELAAMELDLIVAQAIPICPACPGGESSHADGHWHWRGPGVQWLRAHYAETRRPRDGHGRATARTLQHGALNCSDDRRAERTPRGTPIRQHPRRVVTRLAGGCTRGSKATWSGSEAISRNKSRGAWRGAAFDGCATSTARLRKLSRPRLSLANRQTRIRSVRCRAPPASYLSGTIVRRGWWADDLGTGPERTNADRRKDDG